MSEGLRVKYNRRELKELFLRYIKFTLAPQRLMIARILMKIERLL
jgi:hypothetical protein